MPNVLILGGSGYLGTAIAQALLRSGGYAVWGTARSAAKAAQLRTNEVSPVETVHLADPQTLAQTIDAHHIDAVIDASSAYEQAAGVLGAVILAAKARADALAKDKAVGPKLAFIYTSGSWVHGSPSRRVSDLTPPGTSLAPGKPATAVTWRPAHEQAILAARDVLDVAILRPAAIYGRGSWVWGTWWGPLLAAAQSGSRDAIQIPADKGARTGVVHVDDLAAAYLGALDRIHGQLGSWPVFDVGAENLSIVDLLEAAKAALGVEAELAYGGTHGNAFLEALSLVANSDFSRAKLVLAWVPKRVDFVPNTAVYVDAWRATEEMKPKA
ncbi:NAD dependent epimerase/dehydratase family protein [Lentithecium fluviatile CBS 122367]|uniref:NAD dependent epimerase/dehydratase family protein n=1 Tax=Lentithecium fluviatile CBS 122367 TaxID=1168545 RepID=A0A6G1IKG0_9PLEO|nr:NAD dependent epimerase/dehydratase family protein [Lentithecium fluviatile CBS 122367]